MILLGPRIIYMHLDLLFTALMLCLLIVELPVLLVFGVGFGITGSCIC